MALLHISVEWYTRNKINVPRVKQQQQRIPFEWKNAIRSCFFSRHDDD